MRLFLLVTFLLSGCCAAGAAALLWLSDDRSFAQEFERENGCVPGTFHSGLMKCRACIDASGCEIEVCVALDYDRWVRCPGAAVQHDFVNY